MFSKEIIAIIPARGGSKGIPQKNIYPLAGKPLIAHTIDSVLRSNLVNRIIVSTDNTEIARISRQYGAESISRPEEISGDLISSEAALLHVLEYLKTTEGTLPYITVFLQCTSPLTSPDDIDGIVKTLIDKNADSAFTVTPFHHFLWKPDIDGGVVGINHDKNVRLMRQERGSEYLETGAVYVMRTEGFMKAKYRFFGKSIMYTTPPERCLEIDDYIDLKVAEVFFEMNGFHQNVMELPNPIEGLILDFDGVITNNKVIVNQDGCESVICDRGDGMGFDQLKQLDIPLLVLSTEKNPVVQARCEKLDIPFLQGIVDKLDVFKKWLEQNEVDPAQVIYLGNDINDISCMSYVGCGIAVGDAYPEVKAIAKIVLCSKGGDGAIRELSKMIAMRLNEANSSNTSFSVVLS
ncbi:MAG: acylneuraminate cytidylyltransferase [Candidatus Thermoplasmatota archaeon]|nr:acylneuraminate cytidylyltransferase [Candidatus Thermoplasmatota archaeon]